MPLDMIAAHQWFNIAAALGMKDAARLRNEVAAEMSEREIALAQRAATFTGDKSAGDIWSVAACK
jgi:hypothetical protein